MDDGWAAEIGQRMKTARKAAGLSRRQVAEAIGRDEGTIASYEQGKRAPFKEIREIAALIKADLPQLLHGDAYQSPLERIEQDLRDLSTLVRERLPEPQLRDGFAEDPAAPVASPSEQAG